MSILTPKNGKYVPTSLTTLKDGEKTTNLAIFSEDYAKRIVNVVENGGGGGGGGTGDVTTEQLNEEIQARIDGDNTLTTNLNKEIQDRTNADTTLQANINAEKSARENADTNLQNQIDNISTGSATIKQIDVSSSINVKNITFTFVNNVMIMQGNVFPFIDSTEDQTVDANGNVLIKKCDLGLSTILNTNNDTIENIIKEYNPNVDLNKLSGNGNGIYNTTTPLQARLGSGGMEVVNNYITCGCAYSHITNTGENLLSFLVLINAFTVNTTTRTFSSTSLKYLNCPFTLTIPLVNKTE